MIVGLALRLPGIWERALWYDEGFTIRLSQLGWGDLVDRAAHGDNHPPVFYALLKLWIAAFGRSLLAMRLLDVLLGLGTIWVVFALALRTVPKREGRPALVAATAAAGWIAVHPTLVMWSVQIRMYALAGLLAVSAALLLLRALERPLSWARWAAWTLVAIGLVYTHYYGAFIVLTQGLFAFVIAVRSPDRRAVVARVLASGLAICVAFAPWLHVVREQQGHITGGHWWIPALATDHVFWDLARIPGLLDDAEYALPTGVWQVVLGALCLGVVGLVVAAAVIQRERGTRLAGLCTITPLLGGLAVSLVLGSSVVYARYLIVAQVFAPLAVVGVLYARTSTRTATLLLAPIAIAVVVSLAGQLPALVPQPDVPAAAAWIAQRRERDEPVIVQFFFYWSFRYERTEYDPTLRQYRVGYTRLPPEPSEDAVFGPALLSRVHGHVFVVDSAKFHVPLPPRFHALAHEVFQTALPSDLLQVTLYDVR
jgi:hypothetical protein